MKSGLPHAIAILALSGCDPGATTTTLTEPASARSYRVFAPRHHDPGRPSPVLFALHAYAAAPEVLPRAYALERKAVAGRGWILVVPEGTRDADGKLAWNASAACCWRGADPPDDLAYLHRVLEELRRRMPVDRDRVFAIGESNGAFMAHRWACAPEGDLHAIVAIAGAAPGPDDPRCAPAVPVSVLHVHGDQDEMIRFAGGQLGRGRYPSARESAAMWRRLNGCAAGAGSTRSWQLFLGASRLESWTCPRARVALWTIEGGAHHMPALRFSADEMLDFLAPAPVSPATK